MSMNSTAKTATDASSSATTPTTRRFSTSVMRKTNSDPDRMRAARRSSSIIMGGGPSSTKSNNAQDVKSMFMDSFRAVIEDLDEPAGGEKNKKKRKADRREQPDELGEQITRILNQIPQFQKPLHLGINHNDLDGCSIRPLLSSKNWKRIQRQWAWFKQVSTTKPHRRSCMILWNLWKFAFLKKDTNSTLIGGLMAFFGLLFLTVATSACASTFATLWSLKFLWMAAFFALSILVDLKEINHAIPEGLRQCFAKSCSALLWFDSIVLIGKRYQGREWNKEDFEFNDAKLSQSSGQYLWSLPPPSTKEGAKLSVDEEHMSREEWSTDTTKHVVAIDFCYFMVREAFLQKQYSKLRKAVGKKKDKRTNPIVSTDESNNGDTITYTRKLTHSSSEPMTTDNTDQQIQISRSNSDSVVVISSTKSADDDYRSDVKSPTDAIEVVRQRQFFSDGSHSFDSFEEKDPGALSDHHLMSFNALNHILEDEDDLPKLPVSPSNSSKAASIDTNSDATTDLNWMDVGAEIGLKLLGSAAVQKAMASQDTAERINHIKEKVENKLAAKNPNLKFKVGVSNDHVTLDEDQENNSPIVKQRKQLVLPVHPMWTSASAAAQNSFVSPTNTMDSESTDGPLSTDVQILDSTHIMSTEPPEMPLRLAYQAKPIEDQKGNPETVDGETEVTSAQEVNSASKDDASSKHGQKPASPPRLSQGERRPKPLNIPTLKPLSRAVESIEVICEKKKISSSPGRIARRPTLPSGVKVVVPIFPFQPGVRQSKRLHDSRFQMSTVVSSKRISIFSRNKPPSPGRRGTNCLSVTVKLDKSFLRNGEFSELTFRVMDDWPDRYMPKHSKLPLGSCVATSFGIGVLVGWRVEDDCHIIRSLWQRRGAGSACAYLRREAIHCTMEAAVGFDVGTPMGRGHLVAYVGGGRDFRSGRYFVKIKEEGRHEGQVVELNRADVLSCRSAQFIPVVEHIREAAQYQLQVDNYTQAIEEDKSSDAPADPMDAQIWRRLSRYSDILWKSFLRAIEEDDEFDEGMNEFISSMITFLDRLDAPGGTHDSKGNDQDTSIVITATDSTHSSKHNSGKGEPGFWFMNDVFGIFGGHGQDEDAVDGAVNESIEIECSPPGGTSENDSIKTSYDRAFAVIRTLMRTVSVARAACVDEAEFKLALSLCYEFLLFLKTVIKVQQKNMSPHSLKVWRRAWEEIVSTFGPVKDRLKKIGQGIAERMEKQGRRAKVRLLRFVDIIVQDEVLLTAIENTDWDRFFEQLEMAMVRAKILEEQNLEHYHKTAQFVYNHFAAASSRNGNAAARNNEKLAHLAMAVKWVAAPKNSLLKLFVEDWVLDMLERILVRVFHKEDVASRMLSIHATNFHTLRQFRMLKDFTIAGKLWMPLLDAADAELSWMVSRMPKNAKEYMCPLSSLFSLCVVQFHKISEGDLTKDWLDFLMEEEAVNIIHDIDMKMILALESFSRDIKEMMVVLPYYPSIEDDILNLVDEVDLQEFLKEASEALEDAEKLSEFIREKATIAIERFLDYLPKMSIPVEKRDLADGWVLTCRGADGGDLTLTDLNIKRENLTCQVMGGDTLFFPMLGAEDDTECKSTASVQSSATADKPVEHSNAETSVLDHIREMLLQAQRYGNWQIGVGGVSHPPSDRYVASVLHGLPVSSVLNCGIELWRNLEIDDDELLEIAIRDVSYQIQLQKEHEEAEGMEFQRNVPSPEPTPRCIDSSETLRHRFNPRVDPTVLYLEIQKLTFHLDTFLFRIEKHESRRTVFDPVFEGSGSLMVRNVSIKLRVECVKETILRMGREVPVPVLQLRELDVKLEKVKLKVKDTGADWLLNKVVKQFEDNLTTIIGTNLNDQVREQIELALLNMNGYFEVNPDLVLGILGITMDDLEEKVMWV